MKNDRTALKNMTISEVYGFIMSKLAFEPAIVNSIRHVRDEVSNEHFRFDMSGFDQEGFCCSAHNQSIINIFAYLGIYDDMDYLNVKFRKGSVTLFYRRKNGKHTEENLGGYGTRGIIYRILEITEIINTTL